MSKDFDIGDVLTVTTGRMLSVRGMQAVYDILDYMTGDSLYTHQLPRAVDECAPYILRAYPELANVEVPEIKGKRTLLSWLATFEKRTYSIEPIPQDDHTFKDPVQELTEMFPDKKIIVVEGEGTSQ